MHKILIANRGEIARRILRTLREMGLAGVAVYSDADADAPHVREADEAVRIGPAPARQSYLDAERILAAARRVGADAIHPGYGFLAENADFAEACAKADLIFIGPSAAAIRGMGNKIAARATMRSAGVPLIPGTDGPELSDEDLRGEAERLGYPVLVKPSAGGGGKGMRIVREPAELERALAAARREAERAFGDGSLLLERYIEHPRHIEVQVLADTHGHVVHVFERECSIQRRFQKIIEEAPSPAVDARLRERLGSVALAVAKAIDYVGAGTVEFVLAPDGEFYFIEMNTRLQVEHPVTEAVTGLDLVRQQIRIAEGAPLEFSQADLRIRGHAIEARLYAEDPGRDFLPATGRLVLWEPRPQPRVRYDSGVEEGSEIGVHYDPMLAKIIAHGESRADAIARLERALVKLGVGGVRTNREFLIATLRHPAFQAGRIDTHFIEDHLPKPARRLSRDPALERLHAIAAALHAHAARRRAGGPQPASIPSGWRNNRWRLQDVRYRVGDGEIEVRYQAHEDGTFHVEAAGQSSEVRVFRCDPRGLELEVDDLRLRLTLASLGPRRFVHGEQGTSELEELVRFPLAGPGQVEGSCRAPMPGVVREIRVRVGERVRRGAILMIVEAMKMEHEITAPEAGEVKVLNVEVGQRVDPDDVLVVVDGGR